MNPAADCTACRLGTLRTSCPVYDKDGGPCSLCNGSGTRLHRSSVVWGMGPMPNAVMLIGEAPGFHEDREGLPFRPLAPAGRALQQALEEFWDGIPPYITNVVKCRPPDNRLKEYPDALLTCPEKWLQGQIGEVNPRVIVALGAVAGGLWFPGFKAHEQATLTRALPGRVVVGSLHPSYVARGTDPTSGASLRRSLRRALALTKEVR